MSNLAPFFTWRQFSQKLFDNFFSIYVRSFSRRVLINCQKMVRKVTKKVKRGCFAAFCQLSQKRSDNVSLVLAYSFLGMILINCQEMGFH